MGEVRRFRFGVTWSNPRKWRLLKHK